MKKILTASLLVLIGITLTGCTLLNKEKNTDQQVEPVTQETKITDLLGMGGNKECTYTLEEEGNVTTGTMYISGKKVFHNIQMKGTEVDENINYIMNDDWLYSWGTSIPHMKMKISEMESMGKELSEDSIEEEQNISYEKMGLKNNLDLNCKNWSVDDSKFNPPSDVEFMDVTETMRDFTEKFKVTEEKADDMKEGMCSACNMTPDEQTKKECLASLGCN